jgi:alpha-beta hydrolase superfamily lysophospholipase
MRPLLIAKTSCRVFCVTAIAIPYLIAVFMVNWIKFADNTNPSLQFGLDFKQVSFEATDATKLKGWFIPSVRDKSNSTIIISPGRGTTKAGFLSYARIFSENGQNVLLFDHRGQGASSGHTRSFGQLESNDVKGAVEYLKKFQSDSSKYIFALGISHGAPAVISAAADDSRIQAVILDSAFISSGSFINRITYWLPGYINTYLNITTRIFASGLTGCNFFHEDNRYTDIANISPRPVLIFHGTSDKISDYKQAKKLYESAKDPKKICIIPAAGHAQILLYTRERYIQEITETIIEGTLIKWR